MINIGPMIQKIFEGKGLKQTYFAENINASERNSYNVFLRKSIDTDKLFVISKVLEYDFFKVYSDALIEKGMVQDPEAEYKKKQVKMKRVFIEVELPEDEYQKLMSSRV